MDLAVPGHADLLYVPRAMGHGGELIVADASFPAVAVSKTTTLHKIATLSGPGTSR